MNNFWDWERFVMQIIVISLIARLIRGVQKLLTQAQADRKAREVSIDYLTKKADTLDERTEQILKASESKDTTA